MEAWFDSNIDIDDDYYFGVSSSGYINDLNCLYWIKHFDKFSAARQRGAWRLLLCDGYGSYTIYKVLKYCEDRKIVVYCLSPHSSYIMQPLDVVIFQPYKRYYGEAVDRSVRSGCTDFNKVELLA